MTFGQSGANFLVNTPACVAQCILTALELWQGSWFLDVTAGVPYTTGVLGYGTKALYDLIIQQVVLGVQNVTSIPNYSSTFSSATRQLSVTMTVDTAFGSTGSIAVTVF
jgi:hypothetical protein